MTEAQGNPRIRVLILVATAQVGGSERQALLLARGLDRDRFDPAVILFRPGPLVAGFRETVPTVVLHKLRQLDPGFLWELTRAVARFKPDVIHTWDSTANLWGGLAARATRVPHVVISEGEIDLWKGALWHRLDRLLGRWADAVVGNADAVTQAARRRGVAREKLRTIRNGVVVPELPPAERDPMRIVLLGRVHPRKGHDLLIKALPAIAGEFPEARLLVAGGAALPPEPDYLAEMRALTDSLGLQDRIEFLGAVTDPMRVLSTAGVAVTPSRSEGFPNVVLEAMATGTPVVAAAVGGIPEVLVHGETGLLVPPDSVDALASAVLEVIRDPKAAAARASAARSLVEKEFAPERLVSEWSDLYREVSMGPAR